MKLIIEKLRAMPAEERCPGLYVEIGNLKTQDERDALVDEFEGECGKYLDDRVDGPITSRDGIEGKVASLTTGMKHDEVGDILSAYDVLNDSVFSLRLDKIAAKKIGLTPKEVQKLRVGRRGVERKTNTFYPENNDFRADTEKLKELFLKSNTEKKRCFRMGPGNVRIDTENGSTQRFTEPVLRYELNGVAKFQRIFDGGEAGKVFKNISCPHDYVSDIFNADDLKLPELDKITDIPFFDKDGNLVTEPGYHENSRTYYIPSLNLVLPPVPLQPTRDDVERAKNLLLNDAFVDFPLVGDYSKAHTLAMVMQTAARELIHGPTPFYLVDKTAPGTGGSFLMDTVSEIVFGRPCPMTTEKRDPDENRKSITTAALAGLGIYCVDNIHDTLGDKTFASAITTGGYADRMLGTNVQVNVRLPWIWSGVGNNVGMTEEMARRVVLIRQDTGLEDPLSRKPDSFKHNPLLTWVKEKRADLVWSVLTMIQAWVAAGKPISSSSVLPSFESWSRVMGGILEVAGVKGLLTDRSVVGESAKDATSEFKRFVASWWNQFEGKSVRVGTLAFDATPDSYAGIVQADLVNLLLRDMESYDFPFLTRQKTSWGSLLSRLIGQHKGRVFSVGGGGTVKLLRDRDSDSNKWVLVPDEDAARMSTTLQEQMVVEERQKRMQLVMEKATVLNRASAWIDRKATEKAKNAILREECVKREVKREAGKLLNKKWDAFRDQSLKDAAEADARATAELEG